MAKKRKRIFDGTYLSESPTIEETMEPTTRNGVVCNTQFVRVRDDPSDKGNVMKILDRGDEVEILDIVENRFYKIKLGDCIGYISCKFCEEVT